MFGWFFRFACQHLIFICHVFEQFLEVFFFARSLMWHAHETNNPTTMFRAHMERRIFQTR